MHPTRAIVELTEAVRRHGRTYQPGEQIEVITLTRDTVHGLDADGRRLVVPLSAVKTRKEAPAPRPHLTLDQMRAAGLLTTAAALAAG